MAHPLNAATHTLNAAIQDIPLPPRMARLPVNDRGFPVPWFVAKINGQWDFRAFSGDKLATACRKRLCWLCGEPLGRYLAFVIGPMCSINRVSSEPPSHLECAEYAVRACPFLSKPRMRRNEVELPEGTLGAGGLGIGHNPGATLIWIAKSYHPCRDGNGGVVFQLGSPCEVRWFAEGHRATRAEIVAAIEKGLPILRKLAKDEGSEAERALESNIAGAMKLIPA